MRRDRVAGDKKMFREDNPNRALTWHWADQGGRMYKCTCSPMFRINGKPKVPSISQAPKNSHNFRHPPHKHWQYRPARSDFQENWSFTGSIRLLKK